VVVAVVVAVVVSAAGVDRLEETLRPLPKVPPPPTAGRVSPTSSHWMIRPRRKTVPKDILKATGISDREKGGRRRSRKRGENFGRET